MQHKQFRYFNLIFFSPSSMRFKIHYVLSLTLRLIFYKAVKNTAVISSYSSGAAAVLVKDLNVPYNLVNNPMPLGHFVKEYCMQRLEDFYLFLLKLLFFTLVVPQKFYLKLYPYSNFVFKRLIQVLGLFFVFKSKAITRGPFYLSYRKRVNFFYLEYN